MASMDINSAGPLVALLSVSDAEAAAQSVGMRPELATINFYRLLLNSPQSAKVENEINDRILWEGRLSLRPEARRLRELAIMRVAWVTESVYLWAHHYSPTVDRDLPGIRPEEVLALRDGAEHPDLDAAARCVIEAVDEYVATDRISPDRVRRLRSHLENDGELVELVYVIAIWRTLTTIMDTLQVPLEEGYQAWEPDGRRPGAAS